MLKRVAAVLALCALCGAAVAAQGGEGVPFPPLYDSPTPFARALDACGVRATPASSRPLTGIVVPHHLLAADLAALGFARARGQDVRRVVILGPDHYRRGHTPISVAAQGFATCFGPLEPDRELAAALLEVDGVSASTLFSHEHAVQALLPYVATFFPQAKVTALALNVNTDQAALDRLCDALMQELAPGGVLAEPTLIVQSTDFSHYLTPDQAAQRDQETLRVIAALAQGAPMEMVRELNQPEHIDSRAAFYVQARLQRELFHARPAVIANRNSRHYTQEAVVESTSYMVVEWAAPEPDGWAPDEAVTWCFGGDFFSGRYLAARVADPGRRDALADEILAATRGAPLAVNLEGVLAANCPDAPGPWTLCMEAGPTLELLRAVNVQAVSLANNHARDLGPEGLAETGRLLRQAGIVPVLPGEVADLGPFELAAFTDLDNTPEPMTGLLRAQDLDALLLASGEKPLVVMAHWGEEYSAGLGARQERLAREMSALGADLVLGAHSHCSGRVACGLDGCTVASLGNFLFDQAGPRVSGSLARVRFLAQGTHGLEVLDLPNYHAGP